MNSPHLEREKIQKAVDTLSLEWIATVALLACELIQAERGLPPEVDILSKSAIDHAWEKATIEIARLEYEGMSITPVKGSAKEEANYICVPSPQLNTDMYRTALRMSVVLIQICTDRFTRVASLLFTLCLFIQLRSEAPHIELARHMIVNAYWAVKSKPSEGDFPIFVLD